MPPALVSRLASVLGLELLPFWIADAVMAVVFAIIWAEPAALGPEVRDALKPMLLFEGLALHSTPFLVVVLRGTLPKWVLWLYAPFVVAAWFAIDAPLLVALFVWHLASVMWKDGITTDDVNLTLIRFSPVAALFILLPFVLYFIPFPALGWVEGAVPWESGFLKESGERLYHVPVVWLTLYFTGRALWHILWRSWERTGALDEMAARAAQQ